MLKMKLYKTLVKNMGLQFKNKLEFLSEIQNPKATVEKRDQCILKFSSVNCTDKSINRSNYTLCKKSSNKKENYL